MAYCLLIIGPSGSGKTYSGYELNPKETVYIVPEGKELPFRGWKNNYKTVYRKDGTSLSLKSNYIKMDSIPQIQNHIVDLANDERMEHIKTILIDTFTYAMLRSVMDELHNDNWNKFKMFAQEFKDFIDTMKSLRDDLVIVITSHEEIEENKSSIDATVTRSFKVPSGRFTKEAIVPEGLFTVVLWSTVVEKSEGKIDFLFRTQGMQGLPAKSPPGMFDDILIPNNLNTVIRQLKEYYEGEPEKEPADESV